MNTNPQLNPDALPMSPVWTDLVNDFLEMACFLREDERRFLIYRLEEKNLKTDLINVHPCFSLDGRAVIIAEDSPLSEIMVFYPKAKKIVSLIEDKKCRACHTHPL